MPEKEAPDSKTATGTPNEKPYITLSNGEKLVFSEDALEIWTQNALKKYYKTNSLDKEKMKKKVVLTMFEHENSWPTLSLQTRNKGHVISQAPLTQFYIQYVSPEDLSSKDDTQHSLQQE